MAQNGPKTAIRKIGKWAKKWSKMARKRQSEKSENGLKMVQNGAKTAIRKIGKWAKKWLKMAQKRQSKKMENYMIPQIKVRLNSHIFALTF